MKNGATIAGNSCTIFHKRTGDVPTHEFSHASGPNALVEKTYAWAKRERRLSRGQIALAARVRGEKRWLPKGAAV